VIYGQRSTQDLSPDQIPSRKMRGRVQPYRKRKGRQPGPTLAAMLAGEGVYGNPADFRRARQKALKRIYGRGTTI
jgi:hypothetical protein